jgi:hypothetical protein
MGISPITLPSGALAARPTADLQLAWLDAADDAHEAYLPWRAAHRAEQEEAFVVYRAALDREEAAARALELQIASSSTPLHPLSPNGRPPERRDRFADGRDLEP